MGERGRAKRAVRKEEEDPLRPGLPKGGRGGETPGAAWISAKPVPRLSANCPAKVMSSRESPRLPGAAASVPGGPLASEADS